MSNKLVRNEQKKLTAAYVNGIALALIGVGVFTPVVSFAQTTTVTLPATLVVFGCILGSAGLHWSARHLLGGLEE